MKKITMTLEETRVVDRVFIGREALESAVEQIKKYYISFWSGHDPRLPPIGRVSDASMIQTGKESFKIEGDIELFDDADSLQRIGEKEIALKKFPESRLEIGYDKNFNNPEDQKSISEIGKLFKRPPRIEAKHSIDPVPIITIGASFIFGGIAAGFLKKLGEDAYVTLKARLSKLMMRKNEDEEKALFFEFRLEKNGYFINAELFITNPTEKEIGEILDEGLKRLDEVILPEYFGDRLSLRRLVFEYKNKDIELKYSVRKDGVPMSLHSVQK